MKKYNSIESTNLGIYSKNNKDLRANDDLLTNKMKKIIEKALIEEAQKGNKKALNRLIDNYSSYLDVVINKFLIQSMREEGFNCAVLGLIEAIKKFDLSRDVLLITYAMSFIKRELKDFIEFECSIRKKRFIAGKREIEAYSINDNDFLEHEDHYNAMKYQETGFNNVENEILFSDLEGTALKRFSDYDKSLIRKMINGEKISKLSQKKDGSFDWKLYRKNRQVLNKLRREVCK